MNVSGPIKVLIGDFVASNSILGGRIFPVVAPQNAGYPLAVINITGVSPAETKTNRSWHDNVQVRIDIFGPDFAVTSTADEAVRLAIDGFRGDIDLGGSFGTIPCDGIKYITSTTDFVNEPDPLFMCSSFYQFRYNRYGLTGGEPGLVQFLEYYNSDDEAIAAGVKVRGWYMAGSQNIYGKKYGDLTQVQAN